MNLVGRVSPRALILSWNRGSKANQGSTESRPTFLCSWPQFTSIFWRSFLPMIGLVLFGTAWHSIAPVSAAVAEKRNPKTIREPAPARPKTKNASEGIESLTAKVQSSVVTISSTARDGSQGGVGTGFVIDASGLIATCLHVIGEGRSISIQLGEGKQLEMIGVHAWDRKLDLAIIRVKSGGLPALSLGDSSTQAQGASVIAVGNPLGLRHSVVQGVISAKRELDGQEMLQLAIPVEPGNSGGPVIDREGRVQGILSMKSALSPNLGFAIPINALKTLLEKPNPVPLERWRSLNGMDAAKWSVSSGANWIQRPGRIEVSGLGSGFGGRTLCLAVPPASRPVCELSVIARLGTEEGAAGLVFGSDGADRHYGFYPSAGQLRLTRFDGPTVFSWNILNQVSSSAYRPGGWNELRVRHEEGSIRCFVNGHLVIESTDQGLPVGRIGLVAFRETPATFRSFRVGSQLKDEAPLDGSDLQALIAKPKSPETAHFRSHSGTSQALQERAAELEKEARQLKALASELHQERVQTELTNLFKQDETGVDLAQAALLVAKLDNPELDVEAYRNEIQRMAAEISPRFALHAPPDERFRALGDYLFKENGFHGSRTEYNNRANSYLSSVIDDREGIPITLSVLYMELARAIGATNVAGLPLPGHFVVKQITTAPNGRLIDVFDGGRTLTYAEADELASMHSEVPVRSEFMAPATKKEIVIRMLRNLHALAIESEAGAGSLRYLDTILALAPASAQDRLARARHRLQKGLLAPAREDVKWLLDNAPEGIDLDRVAEFYRSLQSNRSF